jgi:hypothetical protein
LDQASKQIRIRRSHPRPSEQGHHRVMRVSKVDLKTGIQIVRDGQVWIEFERPQERGVGPLQQFDGLRAAEFPERPVRGAQPSPGRRVPRVFFEALQVQIARRGRRVLNE